MSTIMRRPACVRKMEQMDKKPQWLTPDEGGVGENTLHIRAKARGKEDGGLQESNCREGRVEVHERGRVNRPQDWWEVRQRELEYPAGSKVGSPGKAADVLSEARAITKHCQPWCTLFLSLPTDISPRIRQVRLPVFCSQFGFILRKVENSVFLNWAFWKGCLLKLLFLLNTPLNNRANTLSGGDFSDGEVILFCSYLTLV